MRCRLRHGNAALTPDLPFRSAFTLPSSLRNQGGFPLKKSSAVSTLKGFAALTVILAHCRASLPGVAWYVNYLSFCQMAVQLFFVLSGYLVAGSWERHQGQLWRFYRRRLLAIAPGYWLMLVLNLGLNALMRATLHVDLGYAENAAASDWLLNFALLHGFFRSAFRVCTFGGWYIGTTAILYALHPLLHTLTRRLGGWAPALSVLFSWGLSFALHTAGVTDVWDNNGFWYGFFITQLPCYLLGIRLMENGGQSAHISPAACSYLSCALTVATAWLMFLSPHPFKYYLMPAVFGYAVYFSLSGRLTEPRPAPGPLARLLEHIGQRSYAVFLVHPIFAVILPKYLLKIPAVAQLDQTLLLFLLIPLMLVLSCAAAIPAQWVISRLGRTGNR